MSDSAIHTPLHVRKRSKTILRRADIKARRSHKPPRVLEIERSRKGKYSVPHEAPDDPVEKMDEDLKDESKSPAEPMLVDSVDEDAENEDESQSERGSEQEQEEEEDDEEETEETEEKSKGEGDDSGEDHDLDEDDDEDDTEPQPCDLVKGPPPTGRPFPPELRARVMALLEDQCSIAEVARRLLISRRTIHRYIRAAEEQDTNVPEPGMVGGPNNVKVQRKDLLRWVKLVLQNPKISVRELLEQARARGEPNLPSRSTLYRVLNKARLRHKKAQFYDPKPHMQEDQLIALERDAFREAQKRDPDLALHNLLFFDETTFYLFEQQHYAWAPQDRRARLPKPKGKGVSFAVFATIGVTLDDDGKEHKVVHIDIQPPKPINLPESAIYEAKDLAEPGKGINLGDDGERLSKAEIRELTVKELQALLRKHGVAVSTSRDQLILRVIQLQSKGQLGLPRLKRGRVYLGGPMKGFRSTEKDVGLYFQEKFVPLYLDKFGADSLKEKRVVWDNASTHGAIKLGLNEAKVSFFHEWARENWGMANVVYLPPRSPFLNPAELSFAFTKQDVRHQAPTPGYNAKEFPTVIHGTFAKITTSLIKGWAMGCGYVLAPSEDAWRSWEKKRRLSTKNPKDEEDKDDEDAGDDRKKKASRKKANVCALDDKTLPRKAIYICASKAGTVIKEKRKGSKRWKVKVSPARARSFVDAELEDIYAGNQKWKLKDDSDEKKEPEGDDEDESEKDSESEGEEKKEKEEKKEEEEKKVVVKRYVGIGALPRGIQPTEPERFFRYAVGGEVFEPESIVDWGIDRTGKLLYRIRWKGYAANKDTWEPPENLLGGRELLVTAFERAVRAGRVGHPKKGVVSGWVVKKARKESESESEEKSD